MMIAGSQLSHSSQFILVKDETNDFSLDSLDALDAHVQWERDYSSKDRNHRPSHHGSGLYQK
jgi:hypothetical protein